MHSIHIILFSFSNLFRFCLTTQSSHHVFFIWSWFSDFMQLQYAEVIFWLCNINAVQWKRSSWSSCYLLWRFMNCCLFKDFWWDFSISDLMKGYECCQSTWEFKYYFLLGFQKLQVWCLTTLSWNCWISQWCIKDTMSTLQIYLYTFIA